MHYFKSCSLLFSTFFIIFYILTNVVQAGNSFWLSIWSNHALEEKEQELNYTLLNWTNFTSSKYTDLGIYTGLGIFQCISFSINFQFFYNKT